MEDPVSQTQQAVYDLYAGCIGAYLVCSVSRQYWQEVRVECGADSQVSDY